MIALGIDTGANTEWALVDVPVRQIERPTVLAVGMLDRERRARQLCTILSAEWNRDHTGWVIDSVGIEHAPKIYPRARFGAHMASCIGEGNAIARELKNEAFHAGYEAVMVTAAEWRLALMGKAGPKDQEIARWVELATRCTIRTNAHTRDAICVAIYAARHAAVRAA
jgi:hypothetical protein